MHDIEPFETSSALARFVDGELHGDPHVRITGVADLKRAGSEDVAFLAVPRPAEDLREFRGGVLIVRKLLEASFPQIVVENPHSAFAQIARKLHPPPRAVAHSIHPTAVVDPTAELESPVEVGPHCVVEAGVTIGAGTVLRAGTVLGRNSRVGRNCLIHPRVTVYEGVQIGSEVILHAGAVLGSDGFGYASEKDGSRSKFPQLGTLILGDRVEIGANAALDRAALTESEVGSGTKIDNLCHVGHNCTIGSDSTISALAGFAAGTKLGDRVVIAGHVVSSGNLTVTNDVVIGGNSVLSSDVDRPGQYAGYPLQSRMQANRATVLRGRLDELRLAIRTLSAELRELKAASEQE